MKAYKITYMRIGYNEPWAGWKIAGKSADLSGTVSEEFFRMQSANSTSPIVTGMLGNKEPIWEFVINGKNIYYSKLQYGFFDQSPESRPSMRSDAICYSVQDNPELNRIPSLALMISDHHYENHPIIETLYPKLREQNAATVNLAQSDILTTYETIEEDISAPSITELIDKYFPNVNTLKTVIKCALWAVSEKSNPSVNLVFNGDDSDKKNIIYIISSLLPIVLRNGVSFRTSHINELKPLKFTFCNEKAARFIDIATGQNNIVRENKLDVRYGKYDFINYPIDHIEIIDSYFDYCYQVMNVLGDVTSTDLNYLKIVHDIVLDEYLDSAHVLDDMEILKKFLDLISVPLNNEKIDWYCAKLLESIIDNNIPLNDQLKQRLQAKLKVTKSEALKSVGYGYDALMMVNSTNKDNEFRFLASVRADNPEMFQTYRKKIMEISGGSNFLDQFYGKSPYITDAIIDYKTLIEYKKETDDLDFQYHIVRCIDEKCKMFGKQVCAVKYMMGQRIENAYAQYNSLLKIIYEKEPNKIQFCLFNVHEEFWREFRITDFRYQYKSVYALFPLPQNHCYLFVKNTLSYFDQISAQEADLPQRIGDFFRNTTPPLKPDEKRALNREFQNRCVVSANRRIDLDFWYAVANMIPMDFVPFIIRNDIEVFTNSVSLTEELARSVVFSNASKVDRLLLQFESYEYSPEEKTDVNEIIKAIKEYQRMQKKEIKEREKQQKSIERALEKEKRLEQQEKREDANEKRKDSNSEGKPSSGGAHFEKKNGVAAVAGKLFGMFKK